MSVDKLVDSTQLDSDLTSVANAIRAKGGTSAQLAFPAEFVSAIAAIPTGGTDNLPGVLANTTQNLVDNGVTTINREMAFRSCTALVTVSFPNLTEIYRNSTMFYGCTHLVSISMPNLGDAYPHADYNSASTFQGCTRLETADLGGWRRLGGNEFNGCTALKTLILRRTTDITQLAATSAFTGTPFASGGSGGTIYCHNSLIATYKSASNWSTLWNAGTITFVALEGSIYE